MPDGTVDMQPAIAQASATTTKKPTLKVVFDHLDLDTLLCLWALIFKMSKRYHVVPVLVNSGEHLPPEETEDCDVVYVDMGGGPCDHHGKKLENTSSFVLVAEKYGFVRDPGMSVLLDLSRRVDNAREVPWDSIAHTINGLVRDREFKDPTTGEPDYGTILALASKLFEINYRQTFGRHQTQRDYQKCGAVTELLANGLKVVWVPKPRFRAVAFELDNADVVLWHSPVDPADPTGPQMIQIGAHRDRFIDLTEIVAALRRGEIRSRELGTGMGDAALERIVARYNRLDMVGTHPDVEGWYLHDSLTLILCGSERHPLKEGEATTMPLAHIFAALCHQLSLSGHKTEKAAAA